MNKCIPVCRVSLPPVVPVSSWRKQFSPARCSLTGLTDLTQSSPETSRPDCYHYILLLLLLLQPCPFPPGDFATSPPPLLTSCTQPARVFGVSLLLYIPRSSPKLRRRQRVDKKTGRDRRTGRQADSQLVSQTDT